ncbi:hypothetical protein T459_08491 [Capsicum annuum]|uniref:Uncharacterized protein n=1 Tax=Capsicum annuum TaxID=4072 RepID=A0A2G2ZWP8_CAPAN|nr:hypothetical protein FXO37_35638 [Capsicum annuum]PHT86385.1 hypothetical protein T459_08491 [Capsicum annuum]
MGTEGEQLTEQETIIYDSQIRVWGIDALRRVRKFHVFPTGLKGTTVKFCKNIVLAGVGSLTLKVLYPSLMLVSFRILILLLLVVSPF